MQVIIPLAGKGTRLRPHTHLVPKPLLKVAGRPVMDWVMDRLEGLDVSELIFITGHLKEQVEAYARARYQIPSRFIEQKVQDGTAGAVNLARAYVHEPVLIIFVDTVFEADLTLINRTDADGIIWAKEVEDYQRFGVVVTDDKGYMTRIVEKPTTPISRLANIGLYYIRAVDSLWQGIDHVLASPKNKGEYFLTDAFQWMIEHGKRILTAEVGGWYDCGAPGTLLETNETLLRKGAARRVTFPASPSTIRCTSRTALPWSGARSGPTSPSSAAPRCAAAGCATRSSARTRPSPTACSTALCSGITWCWRATAERRHWAIIQR